MNYKIMKCKEKIVTFEFHHKRVTRELESNFAFMQKIIEQRIIKIENHQSAQMCIDPWNQNSIQSNRKYQSRS